MAEFDPAKRHTLKVLAGFAGFLAYESANIATHSLLSRAALTAPLRTTDNPPSLTSPVFDEHNFQFTSLKQWRDYLEPEKEALREIVYNTDLYRGTRGLTIEDQINDFEKYWEVLRMGERMCWVPAEMLWVVQLGETTVSRHKHPDGIDIRDKQGNLRWRINNPNKGAVQIWEGHFKNPAYQQAMEDIRTQARFLSDIEGLRYVQGQPADGNGSICEYSDWENIPLGAFYILYHTSLYPNLNPIKAFKAVVRNNYSRYRGPEDVARFDRFYSALRPTLANVVYTPPKLNIIPNNPLIF